MVQEAGRPVRGCYMSVQEKDVEAKWDSDRGEREETTNTEHNYPPFPCLPL